MCNSEDKNKTACRGCQSPSVTGTIAHSFFSNKNKQMKNTLFNYASKLMKSTCPACKGDGWEYDAKDSDSRMKIPCVACHGRLWRCEERRNPKPLTAKELKIQGMNQVGARSSKDFLNHVMDAFIKERLLHSNTMPVAQAYKSAHEGRQWYSMTSDSLRKYCRKNFQQEMIDQNIHPNSWGALFGRYAKSGRIYNSEKYVSSTEPSSHGRKIAVWVITKLN